MTKEELNQRQTLRRNCVATAQRAMDSCKTSGHLASDHFRGVTKMVEPDNNRRAAP